MKTDEFRKKALISIAIMLVNLIASVIYILQLPEQVPVHFDVNMVCDRVASRNSIIILPFIFTCIPVVVLIAAAKSENSGNKRISSVWLTVSAFIAVLINWFVLFLANSAAGIGDRIDNSLMWLLPAVVGVVFTVMGNYLPTLKQNNIIGYRISWTLENEQCWKLTHQFAGKFVFISGILTVAAAVIMNTCKIKDGLVYTVLIMIIATTDITVPLIYAYMHRNDK